MSMSEIAIENFLNEEYSQTALYASFRSIASYVDGLKPSSRKVVHTVKKRNISSDIKVSRLSASVSEMTEFLHGENSLNGVISNMAQTFVGSNNDALLHPSGSFGTRFVPTPSAPRYIFTRKSRSFDYYFQKDDDDILIEQEFEGTIIEPKFFVPILPLLLINGSEGIGTGFAQKILPRNVDIIKKYISARISSEHFPGDLRPYFKGFNGSVLPNEEEGSWSIIGSLEVKNSTLIHITELPIGYTLSSYTKVLDSLEEKKIIREYEDLSEDDNFLFEVKVSREFTKQPEEKMLDALKLIKRVTENYTCVDENNAIREFDTVEEILDAYIDIRLTYYKKRKHYLLSTLEIDKILLESKAEFIRAVIAGEIMVSNRPKKEILSQLEKHNPAFMKTDDVTSYDYLLNMPIYSLTKERYDELRKKVAEKKSQIKELKSKSERDLWQEDLKK